MDILLQDTTKEPLDLPDNPHETLYTNSVPKPRILDAELEAELEKLSLSEGGTEQLPIDPGHVTLADRGARHRTDRFRPKNLVCLHSKALLGGVVMYMEIQLLKLWDTLVIGLPIEYCHFFSQVWSQAVNLQKGNWNRLSKAIAGTQVKDPHVTEGQPCVCT